MKKGLDFSAVKYLGGGDEDVLYLDQPSGVGPFDGQDLEMFNPIRANQVFEIEIRSGIEPMSVIRWLEFDGHGHPEFDDATDYEYPVEWLSTYDFEPSNGNVTRLALLRQGNQDWQIVGIPYAGEVVLALRSVEESYLPPARYFSHRIIGEFSNHVDGPGPVSWDTSGAILDLGDWWIEAFGGDSANNDIIVNKPVNIPEAFVEWLFRTPAVLVFVLKNVVCNWKNSQLVDRYNHAIENIDLVDSGITIFNSLTTEELNIVLALIKKKSGVEANLIQILESEDHPIAETLVEILVAAFVEEDESPHQALEQINSQLREKK